MPVLQLLLHERYGPTYVLTIFRSGAERLNNFKEEKYDDSNLLKLLSKTLVVLCENWLNKGVDASPSKVSLRLPIAKTFSRKANGTRGAIMPRQQVVFITDF